MKRIDRAVVIWDIRKRKVLSCAGMEIEVQVLSLCTARYRRVTFHTFCLKLGPCLHFNGTLKPLFVFHVDANHKKTFLVQTFTLPKDRRRSHLQPFRPFLGNAVFRSEEIYYVFYFRPSNLPFLVWNPPPFGELNLVSFLNSWHIPFPNLTDLVRNLEVTTT